MTVPHRLRLAIVVASAVLLAACLSSAPPAAPVRWFDPRPTVADGPVSSIALRLRVQAPPHLGRELALRTGVREYAYDVDHQWIAPPAELVASALRSGLGFAEVGQEELSVDVERFELDVTGAPRAVVRLVLRTTGNSSARVAEASAPAADRSAPALAAAMAKALDEVVERVRTGLTTR